MDSLKFSLRTFIKNSLKGFLVGSADIVPGISGGTVAFVLGFYEELIESINTWNFRFLIPIGVGLISAVALLTPVLNYILNEPTYRTLLYSAFMGLILAAVRFCSKRVGAWNFTCTLASFTGIFLALLFTLTPSQKAHDIYNIPVETHLSASNYSDGHILNVDKGTLAALLAKKVISTETLVYSHTLKKTVPAGTLTEAAYPSALQPFIIFSGLIAICAMLLPGISGSYMLTILGSYPIVIAAVADFLYNGSMDAIVTLGNLLFGIFVGALTFSHFIGWLLKTHRTTTIALLTGFMIGAMGALWPFWHTETVLNPLKLKRGPQLILLEPYFPDILTGFFLASVVCFVLGYLLVSKLSRDVDC